MENIAAHEASLRICMDPSAGLNWLQFRSHGRIKGRDRSGLRGRGGRMPQISTSLDKRRCRTCGQPLLWAAYGNIWANRHRRRPLWDVQHQCRDRHADRKRFELAMISLHEAENCILSGYLHIPPLYGPIAQLDRCSAPKARGRWFQNPAWDHHFLLFLIYYEVVSARIPCTGFLAGSSRCWRAGRPLNRHRCVDTFRVLCRDSA